MDNINLTDLETKISSLLVETFREHGVECIVENNKLIFPEQFITLWVRLTDQSATAYISIRMEINIEFGLGKIITETTVGFGLDADMAINDAWRTLSTNSLPVILSAFFDKDLGQQVTRKEWKLSGRKYDAVVSNVTTRGEVSGPISMEWLDQLEAIYQMQDYKYGTHWIKFFYSQSDREPLTVEIMLDNKMWTDIEKIVYSLDYPGAPDFMSLRVFSILSDPKDISRMAAIMAWMADKDKEEIEKQLMHSGLSLAEAEKVMVFVPLAFGRMYMQIASSSVFPKNAIITDETENQTVVNLKDEPIYVMAYQLAEYIVAEGLTHTENFQRLLAQSTEYNTYNNALLEGVDPNDMQGGQFGEPMIYLPHYEPVTETSKELSPDTAPEEKEEEKRNEKKKPFWKFW
ncbi:MAG: DUF6348 family protein [Dysgonomonas sp.]|nr:DUF6348 family protein [Dysgonomonas sp.]